jgi:hypothetical protein
MLTQSRLKELLHYCPETGVFTWNKTLGSRAQAGSSAGFNSDGYRRICLDGREYKAHRLAWLYVTGDWPDQHIDHIDGQRSNNAFANLRDVPQSVNNQNFRLAKRSNKTGQLLGVSKKKRGQGFIARLTVNRQEIHLGTYPTPEEAHQAYLAAKRELHVGCTI